MSPLPRIRRFLYLAAIFLTGAITGGMLTWSVAPGHRSGPPPKPEMLEHLRSHFRRELVLTPEQMTKLEPLLEQRFQELESIHQRTLREIDAVLREANAELVQALALTPDQRARLEAMERQRQEKLRTRLPPGPGI